MRLLIRSNGSDGQQKNTHTKKKKGSYHISVTLQYSELSQQRLGSRLGWVRIRTVCVSFFSEVK